MGSVTAAARGPRLAEGKTKIVYADPGDPALALIVHKDDITAGDGARRNTLPGKGALSGRTTAQCLPPAARRRHPDPFRRRPRR